MILAKSKPCPCHSGKNYGDCCAPFHARTTTAPTPEALMRSRYAAFALGDAKYLLETLAADHEDRKLPVEPLLASYRQQKQIFRYVGLSVLATSVEGDKGWVTFRARMYEKGRDRSFTERSRFTKENGAWKYEDVEETQEGAK